jgi:hypothetical protein
VSGDLDNDGDEDLVLTENNGPARVYLRQGQQARLLVVRGLPRGTRVEIQREDGVHIVRDVFPQPSYFGSCEETPRFGLGSTVAVRLRWREVGGVWQETALERLGPGELTLARDANGRWQQKIFVPRNAPRSTK